MLPHANADVVGAGQASLKNWGKPPDTERVRNMKRRCVVDCGWGRLLFGQTFDEPREVADILKQERTGRRDVAFYVREPHVVLACAPQSLFLDPSHTFRLDLAAQRRGPAMSESLSIREASVVDEQDINRLYLSWNMVPLAEGYLDAGRMDSAVSLLVAEEIDHPGEIVGVVMGVDHLAAFDDPDGGSSLWSLAVDPQAHRPGIGQELILALAGRFREAGRAFMDLSVMHDNAEAIALYEKLGFERVPVYCVKKKNSFNEKLFV